MSICEGIHVKVLYHCRYVKVSYRYPSRVQTLIGVGRSFSIQDIFDCTESWVQGWRIIRAPGPWVTFAMGADWFYRGHLAPQPQAGLLPAEV